MKRSLGVAGFLCVLLLAAAGAGAQTVRGVLVEEGSGRPIDGAMVILLDAGAQQVAGSLTDVAGRFSIVAPGAGEYRLRAERIGHGDALSATFDLAAGETVERQLTAPLRAISLEGVVATSTRRCRTRPGEGVQTQALWEEARKALNVAVWTRDQALRFRLTEFEREMDPATGRVRRQSTRTRVLATSTPYVSASPEELARHGYVQSDGGELVYFAPDAEHLLSDEFLDNHCFQVTVGSGARAGQVGLTFSPVRATHLPGIAGTLWLDRETAFLRDLEYRYTSLRLPSGAGSRAAGGHLLFERLPGGAWIVQRWQIRMPEVGTATEGASPDEIRAGARLERVVAIRERGGEVMEILGLDLLARGGARSGAVSGSVLDERTGAPVAGATVFLDGTGYSTESGEDGSFLLEGVPAGEYALNVFDPRLAEIGVFADPVQVTVSATDPLEVNLTLPAGGAPTALRSFCAELPANTGGITGLVREAASGIRVAGAGVEFRWSRFELDGVALRERWESEAVTADEGGRYVGCELPSDRTLRVQARRGARLSPETPVNLTGGAVVEHDIAIAPPVSR